MNIKEIARLAKVSKSAVSRALNDAPDINKNTKNKILKIIKETGYLPDSVAIGLRTKRTKLIGVIVPDLENPFYYRIIKGIEEFFDEKKYNILICNSSYDKDKEEKIIKILASKKVEGIIASLSEKNSDNINLLKSINVPFIIIDSMPDFVDINAISVPHVKVSFKITSHLINNGHKKILIIYGPKKLDINKSDFIFGYIKALKSKKINIDYSLIIDSDTSIEDGYKIGKRLFINPNFTAVFTINDLLAFGIYKAAKELKIKIPDDISIVGNDDIEFSKYLNPPLTTIYQPKRSLGIKAARLLLDIIKRDNSKYTKKLLSVSIVERGSVKNITGDQSKY
jgi:LacI family transcriptional regulator